MVSMAKNMYLEKKERGTEMTTECFVEKWVINTNEELVLDQLDDYIEIPNFINRGKVSWAKFNAWNCYEKEGRKFSYGLYDHFVPKLEKNLGLILLISYYEKGEQITYVAESDHQDIDFDEIARKIKNFEQKLSQPEVFGEYGIESFDGGTRYYDKFNYYNQQKVLSTLII